MIYVIRHGETELNRLGRMQGRNGLPLNKAGEVQAETLKQLLSATSFDFVYSSPQERAIQTAAIASGLSPIVDARLDVFDIGEADGLPKEAVIRKGALPDTSHYRGVEKIDTFLKRIFHLLEEASSMGDEKNVLICGHKCTTSAIGAYFNGIPTDGNLMKYSLSNGEVQTYRWKKIEI
ncbi:histidine phosphatase family protein [Thalassobacillus hwangdonensis]|uniref:Histidine phosphatase family protein n=1 Tax=Thalassobacillus hwangdonensis TaxID=546108 RepID=A0ABW3KZ46_9BACI